MNSFWIILFHTFLSKFKTKSFLITTAITLILVIALTNLTTIIETFSGEDEKTEVAVIDQSSSLLPVIQEAIQTMNEDVKLISFEDSEESAKKEVEEGNYSGLLIVDVDSSKLPVATYYTMDIAESSLSDNLLNSIQLVKNQLAANQLNLTNEQLVKLNEPVSFEKIALVKDAKTEEELSQARGLVYILLFLIYFAVVLYSGMIATEVATEKSSRVMEILISSVSPIKHMFAKILGVGLLSLTQLALLMIVGYFSLTSNDSMGSMEGFLGFSEVPVSTIIYAAIFFILGYFLYATLAALLGSLVSRIEDVQQMITPMTLLIVAGFMIAMFGLSAPDNTFVTITSYIPFFTPMLMFMRVGMLNLAFWEPILGIIILVATIMILAIFGARVYKGGVLMYGKSNSYKDIKKALQLTKKE
ncbi:MULTISPECIES: ABC transporter permease [unclassified Bacillus (in: firmicutes)]|uniref:ABC transporter permease n=1 Tax=Bacillaceae TaxID=186817 RepID=UPI0004E2285D|nr:MULTISPECIES: ABC transporter permease [unclassified Bacillus (in: firmicutes)]